MSIPHIQPLTLYRANDYAFTLRFIKDPDGEPVDVASDYEKVQVRLFLIGSEDDPQVDLTTDDGLTISETNQVKVSLTSSQTRELTGAVTYFELRVHLADGRELTYWAGRLFVNDAAAAVPQSENTFELRIDPSELVVEIQAFDGAAMVSEAEQRMTEYVDDKASLLAEEIAEGVATEKVSVKGSRQGEALSAEGGLRLGQRGRKFIASFIADDGPVGDYDVLFPIHQTKGVPFCPAVWTNRIGNSGALTVAMLQEMEEAGCEIMSHNMDHVNLNSLSEEDAITQLRGSKEQLQEWGVKANNFIAPFGGSNVDNRKLIRKYYRSNGSNSPLNILNLPPIHTYDYSRINFNYSENEGKALSFYTDVVDEAAAKGSWIVFTHHYSDERYTPEQISIYEDLLDYIISLGEILTVDEALDEIGNLIDVGDHDTTEPSFVVGATGSIRDVAVTEEKTAFGYRSGQVSSRDRDQLNGTYIGHQSGYRNEVEGILAVGPLSGYVNKGDALEAFGEQAGRENEGDVVLSIGFRASYRNIGSNVTNIGFRSGFENKGDFQTTVGEESGRGNEGDQQCSFGNLAGLNNKGANQVVAGNGAGFHNEGDDQVGLGQFAGRSNLGRLQIAIGSNAGRDNEAADQIAIGRWAGRENKGARQAVIGYQAGRQNEGDDVAGLGYNAAERNLGDNGLFLGYRAGRDNETDNRFLVEQRNVNDTPLIDGDFQNGGLAIGTPSTSNKLADARIGASRMTFYLDEATDKLHFRVKYADGTTIKEGEVDLV